MREACTGISSVSPIVGLQDLPLGAPQAGAGDFEDYPIILTAGQITITGFRARVHGQAVGQSCGAQAVDRAVASTSRTTGLRYIYESQEGRIMLILWKVTQGKPPG